MTRSYRHVGVAQIYPWRPHGTQRDFLLNLARESGSRTSELICHGSLTRCYDKGYHTLGLGSLDNCIKCRLGRGPEARSHESFAIDWSHASRPVEGEEEAILSNRAALVRAEIASDLDDDSSGADLVRAYRAGYHSAREWIETQGVDLLLVFNGRIDITRGALDAAGDCGIDYMSYERTWFGDGLQMLPFENCLGLEHTHALCREIAVQDLSAEDHARAEAIITSRVNRTATTEWRDFQTGDKTAYADAREVLGKAGKVLALPSSSYEFWGHPDWRNDWSSNFEALDYMQGELGIPWSEWVIRGHPIWAQRVGRNKGHRANAHYRDFCARRGITFIEPDSPIHTSSLIETCDILLLNGGSSIFEAIWRGKPVISLGKSKYMEIGACPTVSGPGQPFDIPEDATRRQQIVKFVHAMDRAAPTFVDHIKAESSSEYRIHAGADFDDIARQVAARSLSVEGKNTAPVGPVIEHSPTLIERARKSFRLGDR